MKTFAVLGCLLLTSDLTIGQSASPMRHYVPGQGYVPDSDTAVKVAEAVLIPVYTKEHIESERPFTAHLKDNVSTVSGTLHCPDGKGGMTTHCVGGVAVVQISRSMRACFQ
jgi:hypothetical protein